MKFRAAHPPTDVHTGDHSPGDINFLYNMSSALQGAVAMAQAHAQQGLHPDVLSLASQIASTNGAQMVRVDGLKARLGNATAGTATTTGVAGQGHAGPGGTGTTAGAAGSGGAGGGRSEDRASAAKPYGSVTYADRVGECERSVPFEMAPAADGLTLEGYAAVFNAPTRIRDREGDFEETIMPGAFARTLGQRTPVLMFNHGKHPLIGDMPLGVINHAEEDSRGLHISARLTDNWLIQPVRDAIRDGGVNGMSFRFTVPQGGDTWTQRNTKRAVHDLDMRELGPVVFPAYDLTTAQVRAALDCIDCDTGRPGAWSAGGGGSSDAQPGNGEASRVRAAFRVLDVHPLLTKEHYRA